MSNFEEFKNNVLFSSSPFSKDEIVNDIEKINIEAHKENLFTNQLKIYLTELPIFSVEKSKMFTIKYLEEYHKWLTENFNVTPKK